MVMGWRRKGLTEKDMFLPPCPFKMTRVLLRPTKKKNGGYEVSSLDVNSIELALAVWDHPQWGCIHIQEKFCSQIKQKLKLS